MNRTSRKLLWFLLFAIFVKFSCQSPAKPQSQTKLIASKSEVKFNEKILNVSTHMDPSGANDFKLDLDVHLFTELESFYVQVGIALPSSDGKFDSFIAQSTSDVCKYFKNNNESMFLRLFFNSKFDNKSLPTSCPLKPGHFFVKGFRFNENLLKIRAVETKFMVGVDLCSLGIDQQLQCTVNMKFYGEIRDRKKWEKEMAGQIVVRG
jgi:Protein of unknown function (DUF1091)